MGSDNAGSPEFAWVTCEPCQKRLYTHQVGARKQAKRLRSRGSGHLDVYPCPIDPDAGWHIGHLPRRVKTGQLDRRVLRPKPR